MTSYFIGLCIGVGATTLAVLVAQVALRGVLWVMRRAQ